MIQSGVNRQEFLKSLEDGDALLLNDREHTFKLLYWLDNGNEFGIVCKDNLTGKWIRYSQTEFFNALEKGIME